MADDKKEGSLNVQAGDNSVAVGSIDVQGNISGNVNVGGSQTINYFGEERSEDLLNNLTISVKKFEPETILVPAGSFWMGSEDVDGVPKHEKPQFEVIIPAFRIGKYPITNEQFAAFIQDTKKSVNPELRWDGSRMKSGTDSYPVAGVTWYEAIAYCAWLRETTRRNYVLPNEAQWEKACRGGKNTIYPWGNEFDANRCNHGKPEIAAVTASVAQNENGCFDFVGNVRQWTCTLWGEKRPFPDVIFGYPWKNDDGRNNLNANRQIRRVVRGSSMKDAPGQLRCSIRRGELPEDTGFPGYYHGFRVAITE